MERKAILGALMLLSAVSVAGCGSGGSSDAGATTTTAAATATTAAPATTTTTAGNDDFVTGADIVCTQLLGAMNKLTEQASGGPATDTTEERDRIQSFTDGIESAQSRLAALDPPPEAEDAVLSLQQGLDELDAWAGDLLDALDSGDAGTFQQVASEQPDVTDQLNEAGATLADVGATSCGGG